MPYIQQQHPERRHRGTSCLVLSLHRGVLVVNKPLYCAALGNINDLVGCCWIKPEPIQLEIDIDLLSIDIELFLEKEFLTSLLLE